MLAKQGPLELVIVSPTIISGAFPMVKALFGSNDTCTGMTNLTIASPKPDGCSKIKRSSTSDPKGSIVAILRGVCNFVVKAKTAKAAGARAAVVLNSAGAKEIIAMPAGKFKVDDLDGMPVTMSVHRLGDLLRTVALMARRLKLGSGTMKAFFRGGNSSCPELVRSSNRSSTGSTGHDGNESVTVSSDGSTAQLNATSETPGDIAAANAALVWSRDLSHVPDGVISMLAGAKALKNRGKLKPNSGVLYFWDGTETVAFGALRADFGRDVLETAGGPRVVKLAKPISGCKGSVGTVRGSIIVVERGECPFVNKAKVAQAQGAAAVIVINNSDDMFPMPAPEEEIGKIKIVVAMLPLTAKLRLEAATLDSEVSLVGRLLFKEKSDGD